jgi:3-deoxy-7-phosphoheptulonate synthase
MLESFLIPGRQDIVLGRSNQLAYGKSVTDACIGWDETVGLVNAMADAVTRRRERMGVVTA